MGILDIGSIIGIHSPTLPEAPVGQGLLFCNDEAGCEKILRAQLQLEPLHNDQLRKANILRLM